MRKACFAFVLVIAAFTGGAVMNGPGLEWLKAAIRARMEISTTIGPKSNMAEAPSEKQVDAPIADPDHPRTVPAAPLPPLSLEAINGPANPSEKSKSTIAVPPPTPKSAAKPVELAPPGEPMLPRINDPEVAPVSQPAPLSRIEPTASRDWVDLRRRMKELGVSRYEVEGEPGGKSRFRCLIPLAGRRAVGQQFEGEGDDDFQAADAALRRVALWKATEHISQ